MKVVDTNILVYAHRREMPFHERAQAVVTEVAEANMAWGIAWPSVHEFLAVVTNDRIFKAASPMAKAWDFLGRIMESPSLCMLSETSDHALILRDILVSSRVAGPKVHDARIAAICLGHGVEVLLTADRDFSRFKGLTVRNPLV